MNYTIAIDPNEPHFLNLRLSILNIHQDMIAVQLPSWRPGRYELQHYAKNIRSFTIVDSQGSPVAFRKTTKDRWEINTANIREVYIEYQYYANQYDAGASYVVADMMYVNPVNCLMYVEGRADEPYEVKLNIPENYTIACQLPHQHQTLFAQSFDQLADSPWIASPNLSYQLITVQPQQSQHTEVNIHFWFQGKACPQMGQLVADTIKYTQEQIALFGDFPCKDYHFLYHILPTTFRHGVEHADSTVIAMGPDSDWENEAFYNSFIAISSHELFHLWNIKRIRPIEMLPYDFTKENYSTLGYVYEGVTTYYGDLLLLTGGVWSWSEYAESFGSDLARHVSNMGRHHYSVAESSFDTWLDGYVAGIPGRKVSIYIEGMLAAWVADIQIIHHTNGQQSLDDVMRALYERFAKNGKGYTESDYQQLLEEMSGISFEVYFRELIWGKGHFEKWIHQTAELIGCTVDLEAAQIHQHKEISPTQLRNFTKWTQSRFAAVAKNPIFDQPN